MTRRRAVPRPADPLATVLLALARRAKEAYLYWQADLAAVRARGERRHGTESFARHAQAELCLLTALTTGRLPSRYRIDGVTLSTDPHRAMLQLREHVVGHRPENAIEAGHEPARLAYLDACAAPLSAAERELARRLAALVTARRDTVIDRAESLAR
jgi:hypothetical protein